MGDILLYVNIINVLVVVTINNLRTYIAERPLDFGDSESVSVQLLEVYVEPSRMDDGTIWEVSVKTNGDLR